MPPFSIPSLSEVGGTIRSHVGGVAILAASPTNNHFTLDTSGVAGFFGGDVATSAMITSHIYAGRRWLCWYNQPGSFEVARRYGQLARSRFWDALYPGANVDPASLFQFHTTEHGPKYIFVDMKEAASPYVTGYAARLFLDHCKEMEPCRPSHQGKKTPDIGSVTVVKLEPFPKDSGTAQLPQPISMKRAAALPVLVSLATSTMCALLSDWYCFSMILFGMACNGIACCIAGRGALEFKLFKAPNANHGVFRAGILYDGNDIVVMKGTRHTLNAITQGRFQVRYDSHPEHHDIGFCTVLLTLQLLAQLLLVPQGHFYGQLLFLISLAASWAHNSYLSSPDIATLLRTVLFKQVLGIEDTAGVQAPGPHEEGQANMTQPMNVKQYRFWTRTTTVVFILLVIVPSTKGEGAIRRVLDRLLKDNTPVWVTWKEIVVKCIEEHRAKIGPLSPLRSDFEFDFSDENELSELNIEEKLELLKLGDYADLAVEMYQTYQESPPVAKGSIAPTQIECCGLDMPIAPR